MHADRNLLFGILALQMDFITRDQLVSAMNAWVLDKAKPLAALLLEQKALTADTRALLDALVDKHLALHDNDAQKSLAAVSSVDSVKQDLGSIGDGDVQASLQHLATPIRGRVTGDEGATDPNATVGAPTSAGLRFRILRPHAVGGLGEVFAAHDEELHREVALKQIKPQHADNTQARARFLLEAEITGGLEHPGVVPVYGLGQYADGRPFYAMRFIKGDSLKEAIERFHNQSRDRQGAVSRKPLLDGRGSDHTVAFRKLLGRFIDVCEAIQYAHDRGVLHRDLKPGNIMLGKYGETLVVDWGLAKLARRASEGADRGSATEEPPLLPPSASGSSETLPGAAVGTPSFMSPEQAAGRLDQLGPASDVYSLGATLYTLLTGKPPVEGPNAAEVLKRVREGTIPPPSQVAEVDRALEAVCMKAMALAPADRYASPRALADDLERWLADKPVSAWREPMIVRTRRWMRSHPTAISSMAAAVLVAVVGLSIGAYVLGEKNTELSSVNSSLSDAKIRLETANHELKTSEAKANAEREIAQRRSYASDLQLAQGSWMNFQFDHLRELLDGQRPEHTGGLDLRGFEWHYWHRLARPTSIFRLAEEASPPSRPLTVQTTPDGAVIVAFREDSSSDRIGRGLTAVEVWDTATKKRRVSLNIPPGLVYIAALSPDGKTMALASFNGPELWDVAANKRVRTLAGQRGEVRTMAFSADGKRLAIGSAVWDLPDADWAKGEVKVWDTGSGKPVGDTLAFADPVSSLAFSADGTLATGTGRLLSEEHFLQQEAGRISQAPIVVQVWHAETLKPVCDLKAPGGAITHLAFDPKGRRLLAASRDQVLRLWEIQTRRETFVLREKDLAGPIGALAFHPGGESFATAEATRFDTRPGVIRLRNVDSGEELFSLRGHRFPILALAFRPDGKHLVSADRSGVVNEFHLGKNADVFVVKGRGLGPYGYDAKNQHLTVLDGTVLKVHDLTTGGEVNAVETRPEGETNLATWMLGSDHPYMVMLWGRKLSVWDVSSRQRVRELAVPAHKKGNLLRFWFSPGGRRLACIIDNSLQIWDLASGKELVSFQGPGGFGTFGDDGDVFVSQSDRLHVWDLQTDRAWHFGPPELPGAHTWTVSEEGIVCSFLPPAKLETKTLNPMGRKLRVAPPRAFDGQRFYTKEKEYVQFGDHAAEFLKDHKVRLVHMPTQRALSTIYHWSEASEPLRVTFDPGRKRLASAAAINLSRTDSGLLGPQGPLSVRKGAYEIKLWDPRVGQELITLRPPAGGLGYPWSFTPDGHFLMLEIGHAVVVWNGTPQELAP